MIGFHGRRTALKMLGGSLALSGAASMGLLPAQGTAVPQELLPSGAASLRELAKRLAKAPRRRNFKTVPMILDHPELWDHEALSEVIAYRPAAKQVWDSKDIGGPWLNLMRNAVNCQIWSFRQPDFLAASMTHGTAQLALFDQSAWDKYQLASRTGGAFSSNKLILDTPAAAADPSDFQNPQGVFSLENNSIPALMRRGVVFGSCHNAIWETAVALIKDGVNPDKLSVEALAADLTNRLAPGVILTPGAVGTLPVLQAAGFHYAT
ncbi:hypothetical protein OMW55_05170 [Sphingomonas sp. BN140010]|uniref:Transcriptional initiation protein Tat n=1 Tax=Sphingomonas arvum TaxID=2992113 RepID=A0ABT3JDP1_9SPHN|nr:hypothetical protein [Sphingomonas sp. BN140010]MCW3797198.1 hypothetical protein [Sphingomonas sp. BN140010]